MRKRIFYVYLPPIVTSTSKDFEYIHYETKEYRHRLDKSHPHYSHDIDSYRECWQRIPPAQGRHPVIHDAYLPHHHGLSREYREKPKGDGKIPDVSRFALRHHGNRFLCPLLFHAGERWHHGTVTLSDL